MQLVNIFQRYILNRNPNEEQKKDIEHPTEQVANEDVKSYFEQ